MITFGLTQEQALKIVELDALHLWDTVVVRDVPSFRRLPEKEFLEHRQEFIHHRIEEYLYDQCAFETSDANWICVYPDAFDIIVGAA